MASETKLDHEPEKETRLDTEERRAVEEIGVFSPSVIFEAIRRAFPSRRVRIADRGLREGILVELMRADGAWSRTW